MKRALTAWLAGWIALWAGGCGTVCNLGGGLIHPDTEPRVYGGVQRDLEFIEGLTHKPLFPDGVNTGGGNNVAAAVIVGCCLGLMVTDPVLSFLGDTMTLPITVYAQHRREAAYGDQTAGVPPPNQTETAPATLGEPRAPEPTQAGQSAPDWVEGLRAEIVQGMKPPVKPAVAGVPPAPLGPGNAAVPDHESAQRPNAGGSPSSAPGLPGS